VANEGTLMRPHVVAGIGQGGVVLARQSESSGPAVVGHPMAPATARELSNLLEGVVRQGTGKGAGAPGYRVAGKTGTAQIPVRGGYSSNGYLPSFVGFAPVDRPVMTGVVAIAEPQGWEYHGGQVAAPVFGAIARQVLLYLGIRPERQAPGLWPGEVQMATVTPPDAIPGESPTPVEQPVPVAFEPAEDIGIVEPESVPASTGGGRSHAPF
jgi:stage V sporulation protein D (sporulation-specific penicillin-binding protein)